MSTNEQPPPRSFKAKQSDGVPSIQQLYDEAAQNEEILRRYQTFELQMLSAVTFESLLNTLLNKSLQILRLDAVELWLCDPQKTLNEIVPDAILGQREIQLLSNERIFERLYPDPPTVRLASTHTFSRLPVFKERPMLRSAAMLPLHRNNRFVGSMHFGAKDEQRFNAHKSTDFMSHLASIVGVCIENARSQEHLRRLSMLDALTKVNNRRGFQLALDREISRATRSGLPLSLLFVDLDHFKVVNDSYGHPMGDKVLRVVAQLLREMLRKIDHVCRYGGEEFALILPNCHRTLAMDIAERLRHRVSQLQITLEDQEKVSVNAISVTLSMGVCCWEPDRYPMDRDETTIADALIARSDRGVYEAKQQGRNTVRYVSL